MSLANELLESIEDQDLVGVGEEVQYEGRPAEVIQIDDDAILILMTDNDEDEVYAISLDDLDEDEEEVSETKVPRARRVGKRIAFKNGKKVIVKAHRTKPMSRKQLVALRKAAKKRKGKRLKASTLRKRKLSMKARKRANK